MRHPFTLVLLILLCPNSKVVMPEDWELRVDITLRALFKGAGWSDDRKADLYSLICDGCDECKTYQDLELFINRCLWKNEEWAKRHG